MSTTVTRLFFYTMDLMTISGKGEKACRKVLQQMREFFKLAPHQQLTVYHASEFLGIPVEKLFPYLKSYPFLVSRKT
ncbi:hypothetical protein [Pedobacter sp. SYSU D00535]|uniref:hypothetical protein n=1 Tax=Pedobacter sp. SYSU D00535 TaxID=2810308 RepID=UPI001A95941B|nr:hypothetical protein [Pedobacter sp. SYSU D00535]